MAYKALLDFTLCSFTARLKLPDALIAVLSICTVSLSLSLSLSLCHWWNPVNGILLCAVVLLQTILSLFPLSVQDLIRTTVGQARLLMSQRFLQFTGLVDDCELGRGEKETTTSDLQGFWDMVYFQVEDVSKKFSSLEQLEQSGWQQLQRAPSRPKKTARVRAKSEGGRGV
ncbi:DLGP5 protein, partial [Amia calva]|nr:DLGP5 protein [Amia calva]